MEKLGSIITGVLSPLLTLIIAFYSWNADKKIDRLELNMKSLDSTAKVQEISQKDIDFDRQLKFSVYDKAATAIEGANAEKKECAIALVKALLTENDEFRNNLLNAFIISKETKPETKVELQKNLTAYNDYKVQETEKVKVAEEKVTKIKLKEMIDKRWDVDIFYLETNGNEAKERAKVIEKLLDSKKYKVRIRVLPELINAKEGYLIAENEIRYDENNGVVELNEVRTIQASINNSGYSFKLRKAGTNTPWYISIFVI